jgi:EVE domain
MEQHWLIIERPENWEADHQNGFSSFGLPHRYKNVASEIKDGDKVYCYVSRVSAFSDIRVVLDAGIKQMKEDSFHDIYSRNFAYFFTTTPVIVLPRDKWLPLSELTSRLELTKERTASSIRAVFQRSIRKLSQADAELLTYAMERIAGQESTTPFNS